MKGADVNQKSTALIRTILFLAVAALFAGCAGVTSLTIQKNFRNIADDTLPKVVQVNTVDIFSQEVPDVDGWDFFFPDPDGEGERQQREFRTEGLGSGVIIERDGDTYFVVTNNHVVGEAEEVSITLHNSRTYPAQIVGKDPRRDLAVVSFEAPERELPLARFGNSDSLKIGDLVVAVGNPFGYSGTLTFGVVSGLHRSGPTDISDFIQTDAAINQGNSGGALVDLKGRLIGINTWITTPTGGSIGLGFAIPGDSVRGVVRQLIDSGKVAYGWLGVSIADALPELVASLGESVTAGAVVTNIYLDSPAWTSGIRPGDIILSVGKRQVENADNLIQAVSDIIVGDETTFTILRDGERLGIDIAVTERADDETIRSRSDRFWPGLRLYPVTDYLRGAMDDLPSSGVVVLGVDPGSPAETGGFSSGDVIVRIDGREVSSLEAFYALLPVAESEALPITVIREGEELVLELGPLAG